MNKLATLLALVLLTSAVWAHEGHPAAETDFKTDVCAQCQMKVTSPLYAAQLTLEDGAVFFDDIGCLVQYERQGKAKGLDIHARFVRTADGKAWVALDDAVWVSTKAVRTPMGYGFHAFADRKAADAFLKGKKDAKLLTWGEVQKAIPDQMGMM